MNTNIESDIKQWVSEVVEFSSEYDTDKWGSKKIIGKPRVYPKYSSNGEAWRQGAYDDSQYIIIKYTQPVYLYHLNIYETYNSGALMKIKVKNSQTDEWITVWTVPVEATVIDEARIFSPPLEKTSFRTQEVRLELDCSKAWATCEIDAVEMVGAFYMIEKPKTEQILSQNLLALLKSGDFSDIEFEVEGKIIKAHRNVVASRSKHFSKQLITAPCTSPITLDNISYDTFTALMEYIYSGSIAKNCKGTTLCELIRASGRFELEDLDQVGYRFIKENLCHENVLEILVNAAKNEPILEQAEKLCLAYFAKNFKNILTHPDFINLDRDILVKVTQYYARFFTESEDRESLSSNDNGSTKSITSMGSLRRFFVKKFRGFMKKIKK